MAYKAIEKSEKGCWQKGTAVILCLTLLPSTADQKQNAHRKCWKKLKKLLTNRKTNDMMSKLLGERQQRRTLITEQWNNLEKILISFIRYNKEEIQYYIFKELTFKNSKGKDSQVSYLDQVKLVGEVIDSIAEQTNILSESLILAQDERWRRA